MDALDAGLDAGGVGVFDDLVSEDEDDEDGPFMEDSEDGEYEDDEEVDEEVSSA